MSSADGDNGGIAEVEYSRPQEEVPFDLFPQT